MYSDNAWPVNKKPLLYMQIIYVEKLTEVYIIKVKSNA